LINGATVAHYKVLHELGHGGMGVVCKAEDVRLNRIVALKFLPANLTRDPIRRERLLQEARAASSLDHPNICTIHEIEETSDGQVVLVMAYYDGETLAARIRRGRLDIDASLNVARQLVSGLAHAHERGVVHRDIKPSNVILNSREEVKIVDFGLAKLTMADPQSDGVSMTDLTEPGTVVGTLSYVPPEVVQGQRADTRADVWSSGIVLYEMIAGVPPFVGANPYAILHAITHEEARSLLSHRPDTPAKLDAIVQKALVKRCRERYQNAGELLKDLDAVFLRMQVGVSASTEVTGSFPAVSAASIVVLPFACLGTDSAAEYFSDGLTDEVITDLSHIQSLRVICRTSAMRLKGVDTDPKKIAADLDVQYVLEGAVRCSGNTLRVTAKLINPATDSLVWAEKYSSTLDDVFAIQESLSSQIASALKVRLTPSEEMRLRDHAIPDVRAYEYYLKAKHEILTYSKEALKRALEYLKQGEQIVGENVVLLAAMGQVHWQFVNAGISSDPEHLANARRCADRILQIDPDSGHGQRLLGLIAVFEGDMQKSVRLLKRSLLSDPNDADTLSWLCAVYGLSGKAQVAMPMAQHLLQIDPLTPTYQFLPGLLSLFSGDFESAIGPFEKALQFDPGNAMLRFCRGHILALNRRTPEALEAFDSLASDNPESFFGQLSMFYRYALSGDRDAALRAAAEELKSTAAGDPHYAWNMAECFSLAGEDDEALRWVDTAISNGFLNYPLLDHIDPLLSRVRCAPGFTGLMQRVRVLWEAFED
jgi:eukaryotic-like serine/threonine-protein kinase